MQISSRLSMIVPFELLSGEATSMCSAYHSVFTRVFNALKDGAKLLFSREKLL